MAVPFSVTVTPAINQVLVGDTATFECIAHGGVQIQEYEWVGSEKIALEERFTYDDAKRFLHVNDVKAYDNNTVVDCTATAIGGVQMTSSSTLIALPNLNGFDDIVPQNGTSDAMELPPLTAGPIILIVVCYIVVAAAMFGTIWWLKRKETQKHTAVEASRNRLSRMMNARPQGPGSAQPASPHAQYHRGADNVEFGRSDWEESAADDSYEDMVPSPVQSNAPLVPFKPKGPSSRGSPHNPSPHQTPPLGGPPRSMQPRALTPATSRYPGYPPR